MSSNRTPIWTKVEQGGNVLFVVNNTYSVWDLCSSIILTIDSCSEFHTDTTDYRQCPVYHPVKGPLASWKKSTTIIDGAI